jgi:hypothetical protein
MGNGIVLCIDLLSYERTVIESGFAKGNGTTTLEMNLLLLKRTEIESGGSSEEDIEMEVNLRLNELAVIESGGNGGIGTAKEVNPLSFWLQVSGRTGIESGGKMGREIEQEENPRLNMRMETESGGPKGHAYVLSLQMGGPNGIIKIGNCIESKVQR